MFNFKEYQVLTVGVVIGLAAILSSAILVGGIVKYQKLQNQTITVTGSASENVTSDLAVLKFTYKAQTPSLKEGYNLMNANKEKIKKFLLDAGIDEKNIEFKSIENYEVYKHYGNYTSNEIEFYRLSSDVNVTSKDLAKIESIQNSLTNLVNQNIEIGWSSIQYLVSNLDELKIKMVGEATKNAKERAKSMVKSTGDSIGSLNSAKMGVFQIVPVNSTEVSDYGISDTESLEKKVVAVVNATFTVK